MIKQKYFGIDIFLNSSYGYKMKYGAYVKNSFCYADTIREIKKFIKEILGK